MVIQWWCDFEVLQLKFCFFQLLSNNFYVKKISISCSNSVSKKNFNIHSFIVYKMAMGIFFYKFKKIITSE